MTKRSFYGKAKISKENETAMQVVKRAKALKAVKDTKIGGKFDVNILLHEQIIIKRREQVFDNYETYSSD